MIITTVAMNEDMIAMKSVTITTADPTGEGLPLLTTTGDPTDQDHALAPTLHVTTEKWTLSAPLEDNDNDVDNVDVYFWCREFRHTLNSVPSISYLKGLM